MRCLLDTHAILWTAWGSDQVPASVRRAMQECECFYSIASLWELAIKQSLGKIGFEAPLAELDACCRRAGFRRLSIGISHLERLKTLPSIHRDPFDRLLIAQALEEGLAIVTCDRLIPQYPVQTVW